MTEEFRASTRGKRTSVPAKSTAKPLAKPHSNSLTKPLPKPHGNRLVFAPELIADGKRRYETTLESLDSIAIDFGSNRSTLKNVAKREGWVRYVPPPRGLPRAAGIAAKAAALEAEALSLPPPLRASSTRDGGGEGGSGARQRDGVGWGEASSSPSQTTSELRPLLPPTPNPSPPLAEPVIGPAQEGRTRWLAGGGENSPTTPPTAPDTAWSLRERIDALRNAVDEEIAAVRALRAKLKTVPHGTEAAGRTSRTLADLTATLERLHRLEIGAPQHNGQDSHDDMPADLDEYRLELTRRIRQFLEGRSAGRDGGGAAAPAVEGA